MAQQPTAAAPAAISQVANLCFQRTHDVTGASRQNADRTTIAETKPALKKIMSGIASGLPKMIEASQAITAAGTTAFLIANFIRSLPRADCGPTNTINGGSQPPMMFDLALSKTAGSHPLNALVGLSGIT